MDTDVIYQGARGAAGAFFLYGAQTLKPPPPLDSSRAMLAAFLVTVALALWMMIEQLASSKSLGSTGKRKNGKPRRRNAARGIVFSLVHDILSALGVAPMSRGVSGGNHGRRG